MDNVEVLKSAKKDLLQHLEDNFSLLLEDKAKLKVDYSDDDVRRLAYHWKILTDSGWKNISYDLVVVIGKG